MEAEEIKSNLCYYDLRNPEHVDQDCIDYQLKPSKRSDCSCDNCFYRRTELAEYILKLLQSDTAE